MAMPLCRSESQMLSDACNSIRFASRRWATLVLAGLLIAASATGSEAMEKPVDLRDVTEKVLRWGGSMDYYLSTNEHGSCSVVVMVNPVSGDVTSDYIESSSGDHYLNYKALEMMKRFKFKPGSPPLIRARFGISNGGWGGGYKPDRVSQPLDQLLRPFLHNNALVKGELPDYPRDTPWTDKHGTGVFELHVATTGEVTNVAVKKPSGDVAFDEVM